MLRNSLALLVATLMTAPLVAQPPQRVRIPGDRLQPVSAPPSHKAEQPTPVPLEQKLRYIVRRLNLNEKQKQHAEGLFAILQSETNLSAEETKDRMEQIMSTYHAMQDADKAGDKARAEELREELKNQAPGVAAERHFVDGLTPVLDEQQKAEFQMLLKKYENATDLSLKPIEVIRLAREQKLTPEQSQQVDKIQEEFRHSVAAGNAPDSKALDKLIGDVSGVLNPTQRAAFEKEASQRRIDEPGAEPSSEAAGKP